MRRPRVPILAINPRMAFGWWPIERAPFPDQKSEAEFRQIGWRENISSGRVCFLSGAVLWALFALLDVLVAREHLEILWLLRFGIGLPALLSGYVSTYIPRLQNHIQTIGFGVGIVCAYSIILMIALTSPPVSHLYYAGVILVVFSAYTFGLIREDRAIPFGCLVFFGYEVVVLGLHTPLRIVVNKSFFLISAIYVGIFACFALQRYRQRNFVQLRIIEHERRKLANLTAQLEELSAHDPLTGLLNRWQLDQHLRQAHEMYRRHDTPAAVMLIDLDDFKGVNDRYGHLAGDELLRRTARIISASVRKSDMVFRYGGDEFFVLLPSTDLGEPEELANRLVDRARPFGRSDGRFDDATRFRVGLAGITEPTASPDAVLEAADRALYSAKQRGKGCVVLAVGV
jgi:diguanylate cyclase (GGDEF)-like protein